MSEKIRALHSAARKYCIERSRHWKAIHSHARSSRTEAEKLPYFTEHDKRTFPRFNVLDAILVRIEARVPEDFKSLQELHAYLISAAESAQGPFTKTNDPIEDATLAEERRATKEFFRSLTLNDSLVEEHLPYRRTLLQSEYETLRARLEEAWGRWSGGAPESVNKRAGITLDSAVLEKGEANSDMHSILRRLGIGRMYELRENGTGIEVDLEWADFTFVSAETFWIPADATWMIYASNEESITFAGERLIQEMQTQWPDWRKYVDTSWD